MMYVYMMTRLDRPRLVLNQVEKITGKKESNSSSIAAAACTASSSAVHIASAGMVWYITHKKDYI